MNLPELVRGCGVQGPLPRPEKLEVRGEGAAEAHPRRDPVVFRAGIFRVLGRFALWLRIALFFLAGVLWDSVRRRASQERRAVRLREVLQRVGGTFIKLGQQMSIRLDYLPYAYAHELEKLLDRVPPFPVEHAIAKIEEATGKPLAETFLRFDPEPIGAASIACVYQAVLKNGDRVAIKVRRPGIARQLAGDIRALSWVLAVLELVVLRPGFSKNLIAELASMLMEEVDFVREARYGELFRASAKKAKLRWATAPRVYFSLSNSRVLTTELVAGVLLTDILAAVERKDKRALGSLRERGIKPRVVAKRLLRVSRFGGFEDVFFHADLHPGNIIVKKRNKLVLIDFGSCGAFTNEERVVWRRLLHSQSQEDVGAMTVAALALLEPLPPINVEELRGRLESLFWDDLYKFKSKHSKWWERTSANIWISFLRLAREYEIPFNLNTIRMIRVSMLADTVAARLDNKIDHYQEYRNYEMEAGKRVRGKLVERTRELFQPGIFIRLKEAFDAVEKTVFQYQRSLDRVEHKYGSVVEKAAYVGATVISAFGVIVVSTAIFVLIHGGAALLEMESPQSVWRFFTDSVLFDWSYLIWVTMVIVLAFRRIRLRLRDAAIRV